MIAPGSLSEKSVTLLWDKISDGKSISYEIRLNNKPIGQTFTTNFSMDGWKQGKSYLVQNSVQIDQ